LNTKASHSFVISQVVERMELPFGGIEATHDFHFANGAPHPIPW